MKCPGNKCHGCLVERCHCCFGFLPGQGLLHEFASYRSMCVVFRSGLASLKVALRSHPRRRDQMVAFQTIGAESTHHARKTL
eukprot:6120183-Pyramimonas_sp.AAC.1